MSPVHNKNIRIQWDLYDNNIIKINLTGPIKFLKNKEFHH